ncbi:Na+/H+ antiporter NhaA [Alphaproteobacteria bacterium]|nr:Na+/H+ antiporter NhaA [Alphaproteobacteria bacterium]
MSSSKNSLWSFIEEYSILLVVGAFGALAWANIDYDSYHHIVDMVLIEHSPVGHLHDGHRTLTLHYLINDVLMALFFAIAGKEVWEALALKSGSLRGKKALTPLIATAGGMFGPITVYLLGAAMVGKFALLSNGWAIPTATDIAFSYLVGRIIFGAKHPAVGFLLLLAIADDAAGLIILAVFYPQGDLNLEWLLLSAGAGISVWFLFNKLPRILDKGHESRPVSSTVRARFGLLPYIIAACASWYGFQEAGIHPALGLLPIVPALPHADTAFSLFGNDEVHDGDMLNQAEHTLKAPVEVILMLFGFANAGVVFSSIGEATWLVLGGLIIGKPLGIFLFGFIAVVILRLGLPQSMRLIDLVIIGFVAAIGFTVSLFISAVAFGPGEVQDAAKMGALFSFGAVFLSLIVAKIIGVKKII